MILFKALRHIASPGKHLILSSGSRGTPLFHFISSLTLLLAISLNSAHAVELRSDSDVANAGYFHLSWSNHSTGQQDYELQESTDEGFQQFKTLYRGPDMATLISGKSDGNYYYRLLTEAGPSKTVKVQVTHHSLSRAIAFFILGALVFLATLMVILRGNR